MMLAMPQIDAIARILLALQQDAFALPSPSTSPTAASGSGHISMA
jgi:hypothetical protein